MLCAAAFLCCNTADGQSGPAVLAACAARRWLARAAAGVQFIHNRDNAAAAACTSLVSCLPALEVALLSLPPSTRWVDLGCLLEALAWCPRLTALGLYMMDGGEVDKFGADVPQPPPGPGCAPAFAKLRSLTKLTLELFSLDPMTLADVVGALVPLTGLAELSFELDQPALIPAAMGQLMGLRSLEFRGLNPCALEAGCFDLPKLESLKI